MSWTIPDRLISLKGGTQRIIPLLCKYGLLQQVTSFFVFKSNLPSFALRKQNYAASTEAVWGDGTQKGVFEACS